MNEKSLKILGYYEVLEKLAECALTDGARMDIRSMEPMLSETELRKAQSETTQSRQMIECFGLPPLPGMKGIREFIEKAVRGELLLPEQLEETELFLNAVKRLKSYLKKGEEKQINLAFYNENLGLPEELKEEIGRCIRNGRVDDQASGVLADLRRKIQLLEEKITEKAERALNKNKSYLSDSFVVTRNGRVCIPVRKEYRSRVLGTVVDQSSKGSTLFVEPAAVAQQREELELCRISEDLEERRILYSLMDMIAENEVELREDLRVIQKLDFFFAKGKLSLEMDAVEPEMNTESHIHLEAARHPMLDKDSCVPLDFEMGKGIQGVIITGPNTGGKTVAIKTVALMSAMGCSGLHVPCNRAKISMQNQILCDIGDGQNISDNLSTFSAHITNIIDILKKAGPESLIVMDELGSGTDPAEGMGIAMAVLDELRKSRALFLVTTHFPEVKEYANRHANILNARMEFDRESLKPLYRLKVGEAGESCALYIAKRLGLPQGMLLTAAREAYGRNSSVLETFEGAKKELKKERAPHLQTKQKGKEASKAEIKYTVGDSVAVLPVGFTGIVVRAADSNGNILVQVRKEKMWVNHKRLKLLVAASQLYPKDYDFSIIFDTVENRKARHKMGKGHQEGLIIETVNIEPHKKSGRP